MSYCEIVIGSEYMALEDNPAEFTENAVEPTENASESVNDGKYFWDYNSTLLLISLIGDRYEDIYHPVRRKTVWDKISTDMYNNSVEVSSKCCFQKWKSLLRTYKQTKDSSSTKFQFIDQMEELMSTKGAESEEDVKLKPNPAKSKIKSQNAVLKVSVGAKAAYLREKMRYLNNKEKRNDMILSQQILLEERVVKLQEEMIDLQEKKLKILRTL